MRPLVAAPVLLMLLVPFTSLSFAQWAGQAKTVSMTPHQQQGMDIVKQTLQQNFPDLPGEVPWSQIQIENIDAPDAGGFASASQVGLVGVDLAELDSANMQMLSGAFIILYHEIQHVADIAQGINDQSGCAFHCRHLEIYWNMIGLMCDCMADPSRFEPIGCSRDLCELYENIADLFWTTTVTDFNREALSCLKIGQCSPNTPNPTDNPDPGCCDD